MCCNSAHFQARRSATIKLTDQRSWGLPLQMLLLAEVTLAGLVSLSRSEASAQMLLSVRGDSSRPSSHASGLVLRAKGMSAVLAPHASNSRSAEALQAVLSLVVNQPSVAAMTTRISCATKLGPRIDL